MIDLHTHSNRSDGTLSPSQLVDYACEKRLAVLALTDHDTVDGVEEAIARVEFLRSGAGSDARREILRRRPESGRPSENGASSCSIGGGAPESLTIPEIIPGIEFSTEWHGGDIHVVGLSVNHRDEAFLAKLQYFIDSREGRNRKMAEKLRALGIGISYEGMLQTFPDCVLTRAHFARYLIEYGYARSVKDAFDRYLGPGCPAYVPREKVTPVQAVEMTLSAGGIPILAHPQTYRLPDAEMRALLAEMKEAGLIGIEAIYCTHTPEDEAYVRGLAEEFGLKISGGSDFHGENKPGLDLGTGYGALNVPDEVWERLKQ